MIYFKVIYLDVQKYFSKLLYIPGISQIYNIPSVKSCKRESIHEIFKKHEGVNNIPAKNKNSQADYEVNSYNVTNTNGAPNNKQECNIPHSSQHEVNMKHFSN